MISLSPIMLAIISIFFFASAPLAEDCVECHRKITPNIFSDWQLSRHSQQKIDCVECHGDLHGSAEDAVKARIPTAETCAPCHQDRVKQFKAGKHAIAWAAMKAMPSFHLQPAPLTEGMKGCGGCHKIGLKTDVDVKELKKDSPGFGLASCDACHTRHTFSLKEARQPLPARSMFVRNSKWPGACPCNIQGNQGPTRVQEPV